MKLFIWQARAFVSTDALQRTISPKTHLRNRQTLSGRILLDNHWWCSWQSDWFSPQLRPRETRTSTGAPGSAQAGGIWVCVAAPEAPSGYCNPSRAARAGGSHTPNGVTQEKSINKSTLKMTVHYEHCVKCALSGAVRIKRQFHKFQIFSSSTANDWLADSLTAGWGSREAAFIVSLHLTSSSLFTWLLWHIHESWRMSH